MVTAPRRGRGRAASKVAAAPRRSGCLSFEKCCETGLLNWHLEILPTNGAVNLDNFSFFDAKADSAEAVLVRPGCTFTGYDKDDGKGEKVTVSAPAGRKPPKFYPLGSVSDILFEVK